MTTRFDSFDELKATEKGETPESEERHIKFEAFITQLKSEQINKDDIVEVNGKKHKVIWIDYRSEFVPDPCLRLSDIPGIKYRASEVTKTTEQIKEIKLCKSCRLNWKKINAGT